MRETRIARFLFSCRIEVTTVALYFYDTYDSVVFLISPYHRDLCSFRCECGLIVREDGAIKSRLQAVSKIANCAQEQGKSRSAVALRRGLGRDKRKSAAYTEYVSILRRLLTQLLSVRCIFEMACNKSRESYNGDGRSC